MHQPSCLWRKIILLSAFFLLVIPVVSGQTDGADEAREFARKFFLSQKDSKSSEPLSFPLEMVYESPDTVKSRLYCFQHETNGFAVVVEKGNDYVIAGYSDSGKIDTALSKPGLKALFSVYEDGVLDDYNPKVSIPTKSPEAKSKIEPLLETDLIRWGQGAFYNGMCPYDENAGAHALAGCVAVTMGQIMRYHGYPQSGTGSHSYNHPNYGILSADFENTSYQWENMPGIPDAPNEAISKLLFHIGVATEMQYSTTNSATTMQMAHQAFGAYFGYHGVQRVDWSDYREHVDVYYQIIYDEIANGRPVFYLIREIWSSSHTVVIDGYDNGFFHLNFGWDGMDNGYYLLAGEESAGGYTFYMRGNALVGISPVPVVANEQDSLALVALYNSTNGDQWNNKSGWLEKPVSEWYGVTIVAGRVLQLNLQQNKLTGSIPPEIGNLSSLIGLDLSSNALSGDIPSEIGKLVNLRSLEILYTSESFTGSIPTTIGNLVNLQKLVLVSLKLSGDIPESLYNLTNLKTLSLGNNNLSGNISEGIGQLDSLISFTIHKNNLTGSLPLTIGNLTELQEFSVNDNQLSEVLPETLGNLTKLNRLGLANNAFAGAVPESIANLTKLTDLNLNDNLISSLPESIGMMTHLRTIEANNNLITSVPPSIVELQNLYRLYLNDNKISELPDLGGLNSLLDLSLTGNRIESVPESFDRLPALKILNLTGNMISELPSSIESARSLRELYLSSNMLEAIPASFCFLSNLEVLYMNKNRLSNPLPPLDHLKLRHIDIKENRLVFSDIATSLLRDDTDYLDNYIFEYFNQAKVDITDSLFLFEEGDSVAVDIRSISRLAHKDNVYEWYSGGALIQTGPLLAFSEFSSSDEGAYYCRVTNPGYKSFLVLETMPLTVKIGSKDQQDEGVVFTSRNGMNAFSDNLVMLKPGAGARGEVSWQASLDSVIWIDVNENTDGEIAESIVSIDDNNITLEPKTTALFRYLLTEGDCDPIVSDTIIVHSYGDMLVDTVLNVTGKTITVIADSIEVVIPEGITDKDFRLTIQKLDAPPPAHDSVTLGSVYDVRVSFGDIFDMPLLIKLRNFNADTLKMEDIERFMPAYFDEVEREWAYFDNGNISLKDSSLVFETYHLTKLSWLYDKEVIYGYTDVFVRNNIRVFFKEKDESFFIYNYGKNQTAQPWHLPSDDPEYEVPVMIQDIAQYLFEVMEKFRSINLPVPDHFYTVYVKEMDDYGSVGLMGLLNHYMTINRDILTPEQLRSLLAHEFMHYTQDNYIASHAGNIFWMEAHAHLADRMVWDSTIMPVSESDGYLLNGRSGSNNIFEFLSASWDYWDRSILTQNWRGNVYYCYLAGTFLHYMRSYRDGEKLKPDVLLKETSYLDSWRNYLDSYITKHLSSSIGVEYDNYVKYIVEGSNSDFTLLNKSEGEDPLEYLKSAPSEFMTTRFIDFKEGPEQNIIKDSIHLEMDYLSSRMVQFYNLSEAKALVRMKRVGEKNDKSRVYLCKYDSGSGNMVLEDFSDLDSTAFIIEPPTENNLEDKKHVAYLLFVNTDKSAKLESVYDLEIISVPDITYFDAFAFFIGYSTTDAEIHTFSDGTNETTGTFNMSPIYFRMHEGPLTYSADIQGEVLHTTAISDWVEQSVTYNFITGDMVIHHTENWGGLEVTSPLDMREITLVLNNVWLTELGAGMPSRYTMQTAGTSQTLGVVKSINYTRKDARYNQAQGAYDPVTTTTYLRTNYDVDNIRFMIQFN